MLAIMASPREGGNTELLFNEFCRGVEDSGGEVDKVIMRDYNIKPCVEIYGCLKTGRCVIKGDDFDAIYDKLETCSALMVASPVFFYNFPAPFKALIDRCQAFYVRKYMRNDPIPGTRLAYLLSVGGCKKHEVKTPRRGVFTGMKLTMNNWLDCLSMKLQDTLLYGEIDAKGDILQHPTAMQDAYELGKKATQNL